MIQFYHRILCTQSNRLLYKVYVWDRKLNENGLVKSWSNEVKLILNEHSLEHIFNSNEIFPLRSTVAQLRDSMLKKQRLKLKEECATKPKLRTFVSFKNFDTLPPHIGKPLSFHERRTISKLRLGILPIRLETARYLRPIVPEQERVCYCGSREVESEVHVMFNCSMYDDLRAVWMKRCFYLCADFD